MQTFDFFGLKGKYPVLSDKDISFLNGFFNHESIVSRFTELEKIRRKRMIVTYLVWILLDLIIIFFSDESLSIPKEMLVIVFRCVFFDFIAFHVVGLFFRNISKEFKSKVMSVLAGKINPNLKYSGGSEYSFNENIFIIKGMLKRYDRLDKREDSIQYDHVLSDATANQTHGGGFRINGYEFKSSVRHRNSKGKVRYVTNNHAYLIKIAFNNPLNIISKEIMLRKDVNDSKIYIWFISACITASIMILLYYSLKLSLERFPGEALLGKGPDMMRYSGFWGIIAISVLILAYNTTVRYMNRKRVKMENMEFEKRFDVYCEDQIESRKVLTPGFMYRILDFAKKYPNGNHEFYFYRNEIYIKRDIKDRGGYMEISLFKDLLENAEQLIQFYIELKNSASLAKDLGLEYFDKTTINNVVIR